METVTALRVRAARDTQIIARNSLVLLTRYAAIWVLNLALVLFQPRYLGDVGLGRLNYALSLATLFTAVVALGTGQYLVKEIARDRARAGDLLKSALGLRCFTGVLALAAIVLIAALSKDAEDVWIVLMAGLWMVTMSFANTMAAIFQGYENMALQALGDISNKVVVVVAGVVVLVLRLGVFAFAAVTLAGAVVQLLLSSVYVRRRGVSLGVNVRLPDLKALVVAGVPFLVISVLLNVYNSTDSVMLRFMTSHAEVGWYAAALQIFRSVEFLSVALTTALLPTLARVHASDVRIMAAMAQKAIVAGVLIILPVGLGIALLSRQIMTFLPYPDAFQHSIPLLTLLALTIPVTSLLTVLGTVSIAADRQKAWSLALAGTVLLNIALNGGLIPYFEHAHHNGAIGASLATLVSELVMIGLAVWLVPREVFDKKTVQAIAKAGLAGGVMVLVGLTVRAMGLGTGPLIVLGAATYGLVVFVTRAVSAEDIRFVRGLVFTRFSSTRGSDVPGTEVLP